MAALTSACLSAMAQTGVVTGTVSDEQGEPIIGATVREVDGQAAAITDIDGNFSISVNPGAKLIITYVGMQDQTVSTQGKSELTIVMGEDADQLEEIVVTGYTTQRKADLTGSVAVVSNKDFKTSSSADPMQSLQGKVAGMTVTTDASPSGTATIRIRGIGSINSSQDPLYVIDGVPTNTSLNSLNANDIESMQVLKDAASASIYGSRAANGVIIITTKQGKKGDKIKVDFSANLTAQFYTNQSKMKLCNTAEYATAMVQAALNDGIDPAAYASNYGLDINASSGVAITAYDPASGEYKNYTVNGLYDGYINSNKTMLMSDTDWLDEISRTGISQVYDISLSNATDKSTQMFSLGYKKTDGILKYTDFQNISARMNMSYNLGKYVTVGENFTLTHTDQVNSYPMENALKMSPTVPVYEEDGVTFGGPVGGMSDRQNPLRELYDNRDNRLEYWRMFGNAYVDIKPLKNLVIRSNFGLDATSSYIRSLAYTYHSDIVNNDVASVTMAQTNDLIWTWSNTVNYDFTIKDHKFHVLGGIELHRQNNIDFNGYGEDYAIESSDYMWLDAATGTQRASGTKTGYSLLSYFGKIDYNWQDLILASFTLRYDGSSRFGKNNRYGTFPAATLGYRVSKHINKDWLDDLKIRLSWGKTGNQDIDNYARYGLYYADYGDDRVTSTAYDLYLQGSGTFPSGYRVTQSANDDLKWETATQYNLGLDFTLFGNSLYGSIDAYIKDVDDMLISPAYLGAMGEGGSSWMNGPSLRNWGMEFSVGYRGNIGELRYNINGNLDFYRNKVTYLPSTATGSYAHTSTENLVEAGVSYGSIVGYVVEGLFQTEEEVAASGQENARLGGLKYADLDGNGVINSDDQTWIYDPVPDFSYGLNIELSYKNFDFTMFWQGVAGQDVYNNQKLQTDFWSVTDAGSNKGNRLLNAWTTDNTSSSIPALTTNNTGDEGRSSSYFVENGSYIKLRTLQIGYNVPQTLLKKLHMSNARVYVSGQNLLTLKSSSLTCTDPENPDWNYPQASSFTFGVQLGF